MDNMKELTVLLIEDDTSACEEIRQYVDTLDDIRLVGITGDASEGIEMVKYHVPDAIILDLELNYGGGNGLFFLSKLHDLTLDRLPYVVITTQNTSNITLEAARTLGADFIITKYEKEYSGQTPIELLRMMRNAILRHSPTNTFSQPSPADSERRLTLRIHRELDYIGISPKAIGYKYLTDAILIAIRQRVTNLPQIIGQKYNKTASSVERAMQNSINRAWSNQNPEELCKHYTAVINYEHGVPTLTEFIYYYAAKLKNEIQL